MAQKVLICLQRGAFQVLVIRIMHRCCFSFAYRIFIVAYEFIQCPQYTSWVSRYHSYSFSFETKIRTHDSVVVVCNLDGKINRTTAWENGTQNSGLLNFVPESRLPFVQISSIRRKNDREGMKLMALYKWNCTNFRLEYCVRKNRKTFSDVPL